MATGSLSLSLSPSLYLSISLSECTQNQVIIGEKGMNKSMASASCSRVMERPTKEQIQQQQQPLKCPRCDSTNTKFCYYNNYSLSQPRHFCKACKRYWTRGGTLRNVPAGGGCRKNKRFKRPSSSFSNGSSASLAATTSSTTMNPSAVHPQQIDISPASNNINIDSLFYGLPANPSDTNFPFSSRFDLQPHQYNCLQLGFSSGILNGGDEFRNGFNPSNEIIQELISSNSMLCNYSTFGSPSSSSATTSTTISPTTSFLLSSSLQQQQKFMSCGMKDNQAGSDFQTLLPYENINRKGSILGGMWMKEVKLEDGKQMLLDRTARSQNQTDQIMAGLTDPSLIWNGTSTSSWLDPSNVGSSVPLI
ncbi:hypothetical protein Nepgr_007296 [Nepenthes gracilis]|uniref:Dof zinc finger protein n=1 Tax=Nepenthes gracilis TaxID=150966 RepID=A0AAD3S6Y5_NEPGR|nr:hypothetical protein Nepgr_007296 [Nepenthes gracilis]